MGIGIGIGAETLSAETEIALYCIFLEFVHFNGFNRVANKKKEVYLVKRNSTKLYFTSVCNRALHP